MTQHAIQLAGRSELADPAWMRPQTMQEAMQFAELVANSDMVPNDHRKKPGNIMVCMQISQSIDVPLLTVMQNVAVINGRPSIWGDFALALAQRHPDFVDIAERWEGEGDKRRAVCVVKRRGMTPTERAFSVADAKLAKLWGKAGPWQQYPDRMLQMRARGFALRDSFADALKGLAVAEEVRDIPVDYEVRADVGVSGLSGRLKLAQSQSAPQPAQIEAVEQTESIDVTVRQRALDVMRDAGIGPSKMAGYIEDAIGRAPSKDQPLSDDEWQMVIEDVARRAEQGAEEVADV